jgi:hypothetical protein
MSNWYALRASLGSVLLEDGPVTLPSNALILAVNPWHSNEVLSNKLEKKTF